MKCPFSGVVAQWLECLPVTQKVVGSSPIYPVMITPLFPSILHTLDMKDFDKDLLLAYVFHQHELDPKGVVLSNQGGWQSKDNYQEFDNPIRQILIKNLSQIFSPQVVSIDKKGLFILNMWININGYGDDNVDHIHSGSHLSGTFWIQVPENSGNLQIHSPHAFTQFQELNWYNKEFRDSVNKHLCYDVYPREGRVVIFPSSLYHRVGHNLSDQNRISVAFNIQLGSNSSM